MAKTMLKINQSFRVDIIYIFETDRLDFIDSTFYALELSKP